MTIKRLFIALPFVLVGWIGIMAMVMRFSDTAPAAVVFLPSKSFLRALPADAAIIDVNGLAVTFANRADLARDLYGAGAWLVLPAGLTGCLPLSDKQRRALTQR